MKAMGWLVGALLVASPALCGDSFPGTEYVSGKSGLQNKVKGTLVVEESEIRFLAGNGTPVFSIPMASVTGASASREHDDGSFGRKMALGIFAGKTEEFLQVESSSQVGAEAVVFKCQKKTSPGMAAKINFYAVKAREQQAAQAPAR